MVVVETLDSGITFYRINSCKSRRDLIYKFRRSTQECWIYVSKKSFARAKASSITRDFKNNLPKKNLIVKSAQLQLAVAQQWLYLFYIHSKKNKCGDTKNYEGLILKNKWPFWIQSKKPWLNDFNFDRSSLPMHQWIWINVGSGGFILNTFTKTVVSQMMWSGHTITSRKYLPLTKL